jgi:hypothetical protein
MQIEIHRVIVSGHSTTLILYMSFRLPLNYRDLCILINFFMLDTIRMILTWKTLSTARRRRT